MFTCPMKNKSINRDGTDATNIFDNRSLQQDYRTLVPVLKPGIRVLDIGCGTGAITKDIALAIGTTGKITGIDNTEKFITSGKANYGNIKNLELRHADLFEFETEEKFDLIVSARTLQWMSQVNEALLKIKGMLKPSGMISVLDYNHEALVWNPAPPDKYAGILCDFPAMAERCRHEQPDCRRPA